MEEVSGKALTAVISTAVASASSPFSPLPETVTFGQGQPMFPRRAAPPSPLSPAQPTPTTTNQPIVIKLEPMSPRSVTEEPEPEPESAQSPVPKLHSTTPELPAFAAPHSGTACRAFTL